MQTDNQQPTAAVPCPDSVQVRARIVAKRHGRGGLLWLEQCYYLTLRLLTRADDPRSPIVRASQAVHERRVTIDQYYEADVGDNCLVTLYRTGENTWNFVRPDSK